MVNWQRGVMRLMRITNHEVVVTGIEDFTEHYRRIRFNGPELLSELDEVFPTLWVRLWFPHPEKGEGHVSQRGYTFVDIDLTSGDFSLDFVLHGDVGPAARWAATATPGTRIEAALTPARIDLPGTTNHLVLAGDLTALPAINSWLETVPDEVRITAVIEDGISDGSGLPAVDHPGLERTWIRAGSRPGVALAEHLRALDLRSEGLYAWAAGEKGLIKNVRTVLRNDLGLKRDQHFSQFYWFEGKPTG